jgi:hypothetical protein
MAASEENPLAILPPNALGSGESVPKRPKDEAGESDGLDMDAK